jgi:hypothetical protein
MAKSAAISSDVNDLNYRFQLFLTNNHPNRSKIAFTSLFSTQDASMVMAISVVAMRADGRAPGTIMKSGRCDVPLRVDIDHDFPLP